MRALLTGLGIALTVLYPGAVYLGLTQLPARVLTLFLAGMVVAGALLRLPSRGREHVWPAVRGPLLVLPLFVLSFVLDDARFLFAMPVLINLVLFASFAGSLRGPTPIVERFARMQVTDLRPEEVRYCRSVTWVWSAFFVFNGTMAAVLAWRAPVSWWAAYTGLIAYLLMGLLGTAEYVVRKARHGRYGANPVDRLLQALLVRGEAS